MPEVVFQRDTLNVLIEHLRDDGYTVIAPTKRDGAILYDEVVDTDDLPAGWTDRQEPGSYRLQRRDDDALFGYVVGPHSWKRYLHPPHLRLWRARIADGAGEVLEEDDGGPAYAFLGVRACEAHAIAVQDRVFLSSGYEDDLYRRRRERSLTIAVNCAEAAGSCFCTSMNTGPEVTSGYDLVLTELIDDQGHRFLAKSGTAKGAAILDAIEHEAPTNADRTTAAAVLRQARDSVTREFDTSEIKTLLQSNLEHPRWDQVAERCLSCANCTMVCPTCFCSTVEDRTDLDGQHAERWRRWDSCFSIEYSYIHGGSVRPTTRGRYRQWLTHKLANWIDQFGESGCVGCGRCITWCPVGIDITEEVAAIRADAAAEGGSS